MKEKAHEKSKRELMMAIKKIKEKEHKIKKKKHAILKSQQESIENAD